MQEGYVEVPTPFARNETNVAVGGPAPMSSAVGSRSTGETGVRVHYVSEGEGPAAVLLVHGLGASSVVWRENISALARTHAV